MLGVLTGLSSIVVLIGLGTVAAWRGILPVQGQLAMQKVAFYFAAPALLFTVMAESDVRVLISPIVGVFGITALIASGAFLALARFLFRLTPPERVVAAASASYVNSNNMGLPVALYIIGNLDVAPAIIMLQVMVFAPVVIMALQWSIGGHRPLALLGRTLTTPMIIGTALGAAVSWFGWRLPDAVWIPLELLGGAAIPLMLLAFGASLFSRDTLRRPENAGAVMTASVVKVIAMPVVAFVLARFVFDLPSADVFAVTVFAALPTAQNVFTFAATFGAGSRLVRDVIVFTSFASLPVITVIAWLLA